MEFVSALEKIGVIAVIRASAIDDCVATSAALIAGGIHAIEFASPDTDCTAAITACVEQFSSQAMIGAGSITTVEQVHAVIDAGATFISTPHCDPALAAAADQRQLPTLMGALTPTEILAAQRAGASAVKIFPAASAGAAHLRAIRQSFPQLPFIASGGITIQSMDDWFAAGAIAVGMGGNLATGSATQVADKARAVRAQVRRVRGYCYLPEQAPGTTPDQ